MTLDTLVQIDNFLKQGQRLAAIKRKREIEKAAKLIKIYPGYVVYIPEYDVITLLDGKDVCYILRDTEHDSLVLPRNIRNMLKQLNVNLTLIVLGEL